MIVQIKVRDDSGKYREALNGEFAEASLRQSLKLGDGDGWRWFRFWLLRMCIDRITENCQQPEVADKWYRRYVALRGIE